MLETTKYARKPFNIDAVQVTEENIAEVAKWAKGDVRTDNKNAKYVKVRVQLPRNTRQTQAYIGDWVLYAGTGFKVYTPKAFASCFEQVSEETVMQETRADIAIAEEAAMVVVTEQPVKKGKTA